MDHDAKTVFCKFLVPKPLGIVAIDSDEARIKEYLADLSTEFGAGNAQLLSYSEFDGNDHQGQADLLPGRSATIVQVMVSTGGIDMSRPAAQKDALTQRALEILQGPNLQVTHSKQVGDVYYIGFTQL